MKIQKIVITGALGHIGSRVFRDFLTNFPTAELVLIDNLMSQRYASLFGLPATGRVRFVPANVIDCDLDPWFANAEVAIHLAAITDAAGSFAMKEAVEQNNFNATQKVALACARTRCRLVHLSSTSVYGTQAAQVDEDCGTDELKPQSPYAETKLREERFLQNGADGIQGLRFVIFRFGTICGTSPGMRFHTAVNKFCWQATVGEPVTVWRTALDQKRPYLALEDAVNALRFAIDHDLFDGRVYNVLTANRTVRQIVDAIRRYRPELQVQLVDAAIMNQLSYEVSTQRFEQAGFRYRGRIEDSITETLALLQGVTPVSK